jgi:hypothetical protein
LSFLRHDWREFPREAEGINREGALRHKNHNSGIYFLSSSLRILFSLSLSLSLSVSEAKKKPRTGKRNG